MENDASLDYNFWTSFADLMLALVLVLCLLLFMITAVISFGTVNLKQVENNQQKMVEAIAKNYEVQPVRGDFENTYKISSLKNNVYDIEIQNDLNSQRLSFSDKLLFKPDDIEINANGNIVLSAVGNTLKKQLSDIKEIQIQGNADTQPSGRFPSNTQLAAMRAIAVFNYFHKEIGIDPAKYLMSATTFGEFNSVHRTQSTESYNWEKLLQDNLDPDMRSKNRRIEIVLIYRR
jgi:flagellar motor protein MotB